ncbi:MAG: AraC family transcriptional regulator [Lentisphaeria bacterium]
MTSQFQFIRPKVSLVYCGVDVTEPGGKPPAISGKVERHQEREIFIPLSGATTFFLNDHSFPARCGTAFLMDAWESHSFGCQVTKKKQTQLWIHLHEKNIFATFLRNFAFGVDLLEWTIIELPLELLYLLSRRWDMLKTPLVAEELAKRMRPSMIAVILDEFEFTNQAVGSPSERKLFDSVPYPVSLSGARANPVRFIKRYIESVHGCNCVIADFEKKIGYNRSDLARLFKAETGISISDYINQVRFGFMNVAAGRGLTQKEIADQLGFSGLSSFSRWKKTYLEKSQAMGLA